MAKNNLLTVKQFADLAGKRPQTIYKQLNNRLNSYVQLVDSQKMLESRALKDVYGIGIEQPDNPFSINQDTPTDQSEVVFLREQVTRLQTELELERAHNREKDKKLLEVLTKLSDSQASLVAGQTAEKQKALADTLIDAQQLTPVPADQCRHWRWPWQHKDD